MKSVISRGFTTGGEYFSFSFNGRSFIRFSEQEILYLYRSLPNE